MLVAPGPRIERIANRILSIIAEEVYTSNGSRNMLPKVELMTLSFKRLVMHHVQTP